MVKEKHFTCPSADGKLALAGLMTVPTGQVKAMVQILHGMAEHKERYLEFMKYLSEQGYVCVIHDHRGHGASVKSEKDWGYFYDETSEEIVNDVQKVADFMKEEYPHLPRILFAHSMGTLVGRCYLQNHDDQLKAVVLSGAPCSNPATTIAITLASSIKKMKGDHYRSPMLAQMALEPYNKKFKAEGKNAWLSKNPENVKRYNANPKCGFNFTTNGYLNLFKLLRRTYYVNRYHVTNPELPILMIAGASDPVVGNPVQFGEQKKYLVQAGYKHVDQKLYEGLRHETLQEKEAGEVMEDVAEFIAKSLESSF